MKRRVRLKSKGWRAGINIEIFIISAGLGAA
jgi:hypothetical protein